ncbi:MAG TPA: potassium transporter TrkG [Natronosporangium sp.]
MRRALQHPARLLPIAFLLAILISTFLLLLPEARAEPEDSTSLVEALFTATSAICVTGLIVVDTDHWSTFGHLVIIASVKAGGYGIMTAATLLAMLVAGTLRLRVRMLAVSEGRSLDMSNVRGVLTRVALIQLGFELAIALPLTLRWWLGYGMPFDQAAWYGIFHGISAFNSGGFSLYRDSMTGFVGDWWISTPIALGVIAGSLGFPVLIELGRRLRGPRRWSIHSRLTLVGTGWLLVAGIGSLLIFEWTNPGTFGPLSVHDKLVAGFFNAAMPRSGGFSSVEFADMRPETITITNILMFIGGGSASTAGGIKVATFLLLGYVIWAEIRGEPDITVAQRRVPVSVQRQALSVALLGVGLVAIGTLLVVTLSSGFRFEHVMFDVISAFGTVGLTTGVTSQAPLPAQLVLAALMFIGRVGPVVVATALALNTRQRLYRYPEERPIVG